MQNFVYAVGSKRTREVALVDSAWDVDGLLDHLERRGSSPSRRWSRTTTRTTSAAT